MDKGERKKLELLVQLLINRRILVSLFVTMPTKQLSYDLILLKTGQPFTSLDLKQSSISLKSLSAKMIQVAAIFLGEF